MACASVYGGAEYLVHTGAATRRVRVMFLGAHCVQVWGSGGRECGEGRRRADVASGYWLWTEDAPRSTAR